MVEDKSETFINFFDDSLISYEKCFIYNFNQFLLEKYQELYYDKKMQKLEILMNLFGPTTNERLEYPLWEGLNMKDKSWK